MNITSISVSYMFLAIGIVCILFFVYFKLLYTSTNDNNKHRDKIIGKMKDPHKWRELNNKMSYVCLFWAVISLSIFIYLKYFITSTLISIYYIFLILALIVASILFVLIKKKAII